MNLPGGRLLPFALVLLLLSLPYFYYGFIRPDRDRHISRGRLQAGAIILLSFAMLLAMWSRQERNGIEVIAEWVTPYPNISQITLVPRVSDDYIWGWLLESPDPPERILDFYDDARHRVGWQVSRRGQLIHFNKKGFRLLLMVTRRATGSRLFYQLEQIPSDDGKPVSHNSGTYSTARL